MVNLPHWLGSTVIIIIIIPMIEMVVIIAKIKLWLPWLKLIWLIIIPSIFWRLCPWNYNVFIYNCDDDEDDGWVTLRKRTIRIDDGINAYCLALPQIHYLLLKHLLVLFVYFTSCTLALFMYFFVRFILVCILYIWYLWCVCVAFVLFLCCICEVCMFFAIAKDAYCPAQVRTTQPMLCPRFTIFFLQWEQCIDLCCMRFNIFLFNFVGVDINCSC